MKIRSVSASCSVWKFKRLMDGDTSGILPPAVGLGKVRATARQHRYAKRLQTRR